MRKFFLMILFLALIYPYELRINDPVAGPRSSLTFDLDKMFSANPPSELCVGDQISPNEIADFGVLTSGNLMSICSSAELGIDCKVNSYRPLLSSNSYSMHEVAILPRNEYYRVANRNGAGWGYPVNYNSDSVSSVRATLDSLFSNYGFYTGARLVNKPNEGAEVHYAKTRLVLVCYGTYRVDISDSNGNYYKTFTGDLSEFEDDQLVYRFDRPGSYNLKYTFSLKDCVAFMKESYSDGQNSAIVLHPFVDKTSFNTPVSFINEVNVQVGGSNPPVYRGDIDIPCASVYGPMGGLLYVTCSCYDLDQYSDSDYFLTIYNDGDQTLEVYLPQDSQITVNPDLLKNFHIPPSNFQDLNTRLLGTVPPHDKQSYTFNIYAYTKPEAKGTRPYVCIPISFRTQSGCGSSFSSGSFCVYANICEDDNPSDWNSQTGLNVNIDLKPDEITVDNYDTFDVKITGNVVSEPDGLILTSGIAHLDALYKKVPDPNSRIPDKINCLSGSVDVPVNNGQFEINIPHDKLICDIDLGESNNDLVAEVTVTSPEGLQGSDSDSSPIDTITGQNQLPSCDLSFDAQSSGEFNAESEEKFHFTVVLNQISENQIRDASYDCGDGQQHTVNSLEFDCSYSSLSLRDSTLYAKYSAEYVDQKGKIQSFECSVPVGVCVIYLG